jgi:arylsulfatase A-like enzyme
MMKLTRSCLMAAAAVYAGLLAPVSAGGRPPNILLVMTDDQGYGDLGLHGNPISRTPNLDRFAREGIQFSNFHVSPLCAPTRASLLTGRYSLRTGVTSVTGTREVMRNTEVTLAEALRAGGYRSTCLGKWHNGEQFPHNAIGQGFDEFLGFNGGHFNHYFDAVLLRGMKPAPTKGYITDVLTDEAIAFMKRQRGAPFFCYVSYNAPHTPTQVPDRYFDFYKANGMSDRIAAIYGMCENIDDNFGRLLRTLDEMGIRKNTLVLFLTDNGAAEPPGGGRFNAGMRGYKTSAHEGGARVPLFIQWPARLPGARVIGQLAAHIDLYPTLLELCGVPPPTGPAIDGISLAPWLEGRRTDRMDREIFILARQGGGPLPGAVRTARYRLVGEGTEPDPERAAWQLYDMMADPGQETDIAARQPQVVASLARSYARWWAGVQAGSDPPHRIHVGHSIENPVTLHGPQVARRVGLGFAARTRGGSPTAPGFSHDWLMNWTTLEARAEWSIEVATPGDYEIELICTVAPGDAGARVRVSAAGSSTEMETTEFAARPIALPHRDAVEHDRMLEQTWGRQRAGTLTLPAGSTTLAIKAVSIPGREVMQLKGITLKWKSAHR